MKIHRQRPKVNKICCLQTTRNKNVQERAADAKTHARFNVSAFLWDFGPSSLESELLDNKEVEVVRLVEECGGCEVAVVCGHLSGHKAQAFRTHTASVSRTVQAGHMRSAGSTGSAGPIRPAGAHRADTSVWLADPAVLAEPASMESSADCARQGRSETLVPRVQTQSMI